MDGNIKDTPPMLVVPPTGGPRRVGRAGQRSSPRPKQQVDAPQAGRAAEFDNWLAQADAGRRWRRASRRRACICTRR